MFHRQSCKPLIQIFPHDLGRPSLSCCFGFFQDMLSKLRLNAITENPIFAFKFVIIKRDVPHLLEVLQFHVRHWLGIFGPGFIIRNFEVSPKQMSAQSLGRLDQRGIIRFHILIYPQEIIRGEFLEEDDLSVKLVQIRNLGNVSRMNGSPSRLAMCGAWWRSPYYVEFMEVFEKIFLSIPDNHFIIRELVSIRTSDLGNVFNGRDFVVIRPKLPVAPNTAIEIQDLDDLLLRHTTSLHAPPS